MSELHTGPQNKGVSQVMTHKTQLRRYYRKAARLTKWWATCSCGWIQGHPDPISGAAAIDSHLGRRTYT